MGKKPEKHTLDTDAANLYAALSELVRAYQFRDRQNIYYYDVSATQCYAIASIVAKGPLSLKQLAQFLHLDKSTISRVIDSLDEKGYVQRDRDLKDARAIRIQVTPKGFKLHEQIEKDLADSLRDLLINYTADVRKAAVQIVQGMADSAKKRFQTKV